MGYINAIFRAMTPEAATDLYLDNREKFGRLFVMQNKLDPGNDFGGSADASITIEWPKVDEAFQAAVMSRYAEQRTVAREEAINGFVKTKLVLDEELFDYDVVDDVMNANDTSKIPTYEKIYEEQCRHLASVERPLDFHYRGRVRDSLIFNMLARFAGRVPFDLPVTEWRAYENIILMCSDTGAIFGPHMRQVIYQVKTYLQKVGVTDGIWRTSLLLSALLYIFTQTEYAPRPRPRHCSGSSAR